jgi:hypothetical protein
MQFVTTKSHDTLERELKLGFSQLVSEANLYLVYKPKDVGYVVAYDLVATEYSLKRAILLLSDRRVQKEYASGVYKHEKGCFAEFQFGSQYASLFFLGFTEPEVQNLVESYRLRSTAKQKSQKNRSPASDEASLIEVSSGPAGSSSGSKEFLALTKKFSYAFGNYAKKCVYGIINGINELGKTFLVDPLVSAAYTVLSPSAAWDSTVRNWEQVTDKLENFEETVSKTYTDFSSLPEAEKSAIYCSYIGGGGVGALATKAAAKGIIRGSVNAAKPSAGNPTRSNVSLGKPKVTKFKPPENIIVSPRVKAAHNKLIGSTNEAAEKTAKTLVDRGGTLDVRGKGTIWASGLDDFRFKFDPKNIPEDEVLGLFDEAAQYGTGSNDYGRFFKVKKTIYPNGQIEFSFSIKEGLMTGDKWWGYGKNMLHDFYLFLDKFE